MLKDIDWWIRLRYQDLLNWSGKKFGATRKTYAVNGAYVYFISTGYHSLSEGYIPFIILSAVAILMVSFTAFFNLKVCEIEGGEDYIWHTDKWLRRFIVVLVLVKLMFYSIAPDDFFSLENLSGTLSIVSLSTVLWITTCKEAPPKEKKEAKKLAYANQSVK